MSADLKVIVGLGNPGLRYAHTRHNLGFWVTDGLSRRLEIPLTKHKFGAKLGEGRAHGRRVILLQPQTFMNRSGQAVGDLVNFYQLDLENLLVVYDDLDLAPGFLRIKGSGSAGGHRGMADIIQRLGSDGFPRLRIGIGQPPPFLSAADYVLQGIDGPERKILEDAAERASEAAEMWLHRDITAVMNLYNRRQAQTDEI
ncbi:MAG: aminoacyl-tRNA hydrolase [Bacillota bacterium]|nr:aminoacyl-tRNA hydrolase [Bacillota bacterium]NLJ03745.1 aminoacyl-tRNA hydrolase [Bacillota bacterium]